MDFVNGCVRKYLSDECGLGTDADPGWTIATTAVVAGRGVVATKDYCPGDVIFVDAPLIVSPRVVVGGSPVVVCPVCYAAAAAAATGCPAGCGWPVCGKLCASRPEHSAECRYVRLLRPGTADDKSWSVGVYNAVAPVRGLLTFRDGPHGCFLDVLQQKSTLRPVFEVYTFMGVNRFGKKKRLIFVSATFLST